jgi:CBS domain-containing membrane protein
MSISTVEACVPVDISDDDVYEAMRDIPGYLDITPGDFKEVYLKAYRHAMTRLTKSVKASDVMTRDVASVAPDTSLKEVAEIMAQRKISGVPVVAADGTVVGMISEKDFLTSMGSGVATSFMDVVAQCLHGRGCLAAPVRAKVAKDIMSAPVVTAAEETPVMEVADLFTRHGINRVPVLNREGRLIGLVSRADVVRSSFFGAGS